MRLSSEGRNDAPIIIKYITTKSSLRAEKYRAAYKSGMEPQPTEMSRDEALVDFVDTKLTKQQYKDIRSSLKKKNVMSVHRTKTLLLLKNVVILEI